MSADGVPGFSESGELCTHGVRGSGSDGGGGSGGLAPGGGGGGGVEVGVELMMHRRGGNGRGAAVPFPRPLPVSGGRWRRRVPDHVAQVAHATGGDRETPQTVLFHHGAVRSACVIVTSL